MLKALTIVTALVSAGALAATAAAAPPEVVERNVTVTRHFSGLTDCQAYGYSFTFTASYVVRRTHTRFYDKSGTLLREVIHAHFVGTNTNDANGTTLRDTGQRHIVFDLVENTFTESGVLRHITVPGSGIVLHESGRIVTSLLDDSLISIAGPHQLFSGDLAEFCAALAGTSARRPR